MAEKGTADRSTRPPAKLPARRMDSFSTLARQWLINPPSALQVSCSTRK